MAHDKNHIVRKQEQTIVEVDVPGKDLKILVRDNVYAYGDDKSVVQMTEDIVGKHADNNNKAAEKAGEDAREQLQTTDFDLKRRQVAIDKLKAKKPKALFYPDYDDFGAINGGNWVFSYTTEAGLEEILEHYFTTEEVAGFGVKL